MKVSQKSKIAQYDRLVSERHLYMRALQASCRGQVNWFLVTDPEADGSYYRYGVSNLEGADGGFFWQCFVCPSTGQSDAYSVDYLDEMLSRLEAERATFSSFYRDLAEPLARARELRRVAA